MVFKNLAPFVSSLAKSPYDIDEFSFVFNGISFRAILDIGVVPFELLLGARGYNWACVLQITRGYLCNMPDDAFYKLCDILHLRPGKGVFTSAVFLHYIDAHFPAHCSGKLVQPSHIMPFRPPKPDKDGCVRDIFWGWNDHRLDGKTARNFDVTERYLGKEIADYCRVHNISSIWHCSDEGYVEKTATTPPGY